MNMELSFGTRLTAQDEKMTVITLTDLYGMIRQPGSAIAKQQAVLRSVLAIDMVKYRKLKKDLPYFVCGKFVTGRRTMDDFAVTSCFVIDLDHYESDDKTFDELKDELSADNRVVLIFTSPSGTGLKMLFMFDKPCSDINVYATFYRQFAMTFAKEHGIERFIDYKTNDVTRACFLAYDPDSRINLTAEAVSMEKYVCVDNVDDFFASESQTAAECRDITCVDAGSLETAKAIDPNEETMRRIKTILDTNKRKRAEAEATASPIPNEMLNVIDGMKPLMDEVGVELYGMRSIQYGVKLMLRTSTLLAEINVFYGKRGFSVVHTPKRGTSHHLGSMMKALVSDYLYSYTV